MTGHDQHNVSAPTATEPTDADVPRVSASRPCGACGYDLLGQRIAREEHYNLMVVRCPECGSVDPVQDYPSSQRGRRMFAALGAGIWLLVMIGLWFGFSWLVAGTAITTSEVASENLARELDAYYHRFTTDNAPPAAVQTPAPDADVDVVLAAPIAAAMPTMQDFGSWWPTADQDAVMAELGGPMRHVDWWTLTGALFIFWIFVTLAGVVWGALTSCARWQWRLIAAAFIVVGSGLIVTIFFWNAVQPDSGGWVWSGRAARSFLVPRLLFPIWAVTVLVPFTLGLFVSRPAARLFIRAMLPPAQRVPFAFLWTMAGKKAPVRPTPRRQSDSG